MRTEKYFVFSKATFVAFLFLLSSCSPNTSSWRDDRCGIAKRTVVQKELCDSLLVEFIETPNYSYMDISSLICPFNSSQKEQVADVHFSTNEQEWQVEGTLLLGAEKIRLNCAQFQRVYQELSNGNEVTVAAGRYRKTLPPMMR